MEDEVHFSHTHADFDWVLGTFLKEKVFPNQTSCKRVIQLKQEARLAHSKFLLPCT